MQRDTSGVLCVIAVSVDYGCRRCAADAFSPVGIES